MLSMLPDLEAAAEARAPSGMGACPLPGVRTAQPREGFAVAARPRASRAADAFGQHGSAVGLGVALTEGNPGKQYPIPTRAAAVSDGAKGPHPAREPA